MRAVKGINASGSGFGRAHLMGVSYALFKGRSRHNMCPLYR